MNARRPSLCAVANAANRRAARSPARKHTFATLAFGLLCGFAQAQELGIDRLVAADAQRLLAHADPVVRGEAALIVAASGQSDVCAALSKLADDPAPAARQRALIALGRLGGPDAVAQLDARLRATSARSDDDATAAAFALGMAPQTFSHSAQSNLLSNIRQGSWKRQRDTLLATLLGIGSDQGPHDPAPLRHLFDDESNRDPEVRALLLHLLLPADRSFDAGQLRRMLVRDDEAERLVVLRHLAKDGPPSEGVAEAGALRAEVVRLARHGDGSSLRIAALATLTSWRHAEAVPIATQALRSSDAAECGQALRTLLQLRSGPSLVELERRIVGESSPTIQAALLAHFDAPLSTTLRDHCAMLAADAARPFGLRTTAALALARGQNDRAETLLRDLFASGNGDATTLDALARALQQPQRGAVSLDRLLPRGTDLRDDPDRWLALLRVGHPEAERQVLLRLRERDATTASLRLTLRVWRRARVLDVPAWRSAAVPSLLHRLLGA